MSLIGSYLLPSFSLVTLEKIKSLLEKVYALFLDLQNLVDDFVQTFECSLNELKSDSQLPKKLRYLIH